MNPTDSNESIRYNKNEGLISKKKNSLRIEKKKES